MPNYGEPDYWNKRYTNQTGKTFDWLENWSALKPVVDCLINNESKILMLGCGNAELSQDMYDDGYTNIDNIDISDVCIEQMAEANAEERPDMTWQVMDVMDMKFDNDTFDIAIDKSTIDALLCGDNAFLNVAKMTREVQRVLKPGGFYFVISYGRPENRTMHFLRSHLDFKTDVGEVYPIEAKTAAEKKSKMHFTYTCTKGDNSIEADSNWKTVEEALVSFINHNLFDYRLSKTKRMTLKMKMIMTQRLESLKPVYKPPYTHLGYV
jgi:ubiquinone/menaquinone biosynthesis C-methylase UbiE